jgi:hypothetical protein
MEVDFISKGDEALSSNISLSLDAIIMMLCYEFNEDFHSFFSYMEN